jgi:small subunit ribosomal protein S3
MGRKVHPIGFRLGVVRDWQSKWHADKRYVEYLEEDMKIRKAINKRYGDAGVSLIEIERPANKIIVTIHTARPGIVIGRGGQRVDETRRSLEELIGKKLQLNVQEIRQPELDAYLVARSLAEQIERRVAYRRAMKQALFRSMQAGAQGIKINCAGRLGGVEIARSQVMHQGRVPLHTIRADVDYGFTEAHTLMGRIGIKVWLYRGDVLPEQEEEVVEAIGSAPVEVAPAVEVPAVEAPPVVEAEVKEAKDVKATAKRKVKAAVEEAVAQEASAGEEKAATPVKEAKPARKTRAKTEDKTEVKETAEDSDSAKVEKTAKTARKTKTAKEDAEAGDEAAAEAKAKKPAARTKKAAVSEEEPAEEKAKKAPAKKKKAKTVEEEDDASTEES